MMSASPYLARIDVYPIKSLPSVSLPTARLLPHGPLEFDRRWKIVDAAWQPIIGKRTPRVHALTAEFAEDCQSVRLASDGGPPESFELGEGCSPLEIFLGRHFGEPVHVMEDVEWAFPDDTDSPGPTLVSTATLEAVAGWFGLALDDVRARFRANLEIGGVEAFWEDRLFAAEGEAVRFTIGGIPLLGVNPCQRCVVPTRDARTGNVISGFAKTFAQHRAATLPDWADRERFDHFYRLAVNTRRPDSAEMMTLHVGDEVRIAKDGT